MRDELIRDEATRRRSRAFQIAVSMAKSRDEVPDKPAWDRRIAEYLLGEDKAVKEFIEKNIEPD